MPLSYRRCITEVTWENGDNLLGQDARFWLDLQSETGGCDEGLLAEYEYDEPAEVAACTNEWTLFNINGASECVFWQISSSTTKPPRQSPSLRSNNFREIHSSTRCDDRESRPGLDAPEVPLA